MRSEATIRMRSPMSYISRTLPLASSGRESSVAASLMCPKVAIEAVVVTGEIRALCGVCEGEAGPVPLHRRQPARAGQRDVRGPQVVAAEADVRREDVVTLDERGQLAGLPVH